METIALLIAVLTVAVVGAVPISHPGTILDDYPPPGLEAPLPEPPLARPPAPVFTPYLYGFPYNYGGFPYNHHGFPYDNEHGYPAGNNVAAPSVPQGVYNVQTEAYVCPGDALYYRNDFSFYSCFGGDSRVMTCAPGSRNLPKEAYGATGAESKSARFCDVNMLTYGFQFPGHKSPLHK